MPITSSASISSEIRIVPDADLMLGAFVPDMKGVSRLVARATFPLMRRGIRADFDVSPTGVWVAEEKLAAAGARFRAELQPSGYLVGNAFAVADLTLAALLAPIVAPPQFPYPQPQRGHPLLAPLRQVLAREGLVDWTLDVYSQHRGRLGGGEAPRLICPAAGSRFRPTVVSWSRARKGGVALIATACNFNRSNRGDHDC